MCRLVSLVVFLWSCDRCEKGEVREDENGEKYCYVPEEDDSGGGTGGGVADSGGGGTRGAGI